MKISGGAFDNHIKEFRLDPSILSELEGEMVEGVEERLDQEDNESEVALRIRTRILLYEKIFFLFHSE